MEYMELQLFCKYTGMWEDDPAAMLAFVDYIDQDRPLSGWWSDFQGDYV